MRVLIDECIDERFRNHLTGHDCQTARFAGLAGLDNGDLLTAAENARFDVFVTVDQSIEIPTEFNRTENRHPYHSGEIEPSDGLVATRTCLSCKS